MIEIKLYTVDEVADLLKVGKTTVYRLFRCGLLRWNLVGSQRRITQEQLEDFLRQGVHNETESDRND